MEFQRSVNNILIKVYFLENNRHGGECHDIHHPDSYIKGDIL